MRPSLVNSTQLVRCPWAGDRLNVTLRDIQTAAGRRAEFKFLALVCHTLLLQARELSSRIAASRMIVAFGSRNLPPRNISPTRASPLSMS